MKTEINKFIDGLEEIFANLRERHVDDSVCGLCEYDGAYMGQSGDWCNECPGFDKDDCFKLSDETRKKWIEEIVNAYPDHTADIGKKASVSCDHEKDHNADIGKSDLKPCPFCGKKPISSYIGDNWHYVMCSNNQCPARPVTWAFYTEKEAIEAWNERKADEGTG